MEEQGIAQYARSPDGVIPGDAAKDHEYMCLIGVPLCKISINWLTWSKIVYVLSVFDSTTETCDQNPDFIVMATNNYYTKTLQSFSSQLAEPPKLCNKGVLLI